MKEVYWKQVGIEDMPNEDMRLVAELCGLEVAVALLRNMSGISIYIPKPGANLRFIRRFVKRFYNGHNAKLLAVELDVSERFIYDVISDLRKQGEL